MHVVGSHVTFEDLDVERSTDLPDQVAHPRPDRPLERRLAVLGAEHEVVVDQVDGVRRFAVRGHATNVPQAS